MPRWKPPVSAPKLTDIKSPRPDVAPDHALSVTELSNRITRLLEGQIGRVRVQGEISNYRLPKSGHAYFVLKDEQSAINAVCFRSTLAGLRLNLADGKKIEVRGRVTAYTARSEYQIIVESAQETGLGDLMRRFMELRDKLRSEGLFDQARKKPLPLYPRAIGLATSGTGAALRDILNVLGRRARGLTIYLSPCAVQGDAAIDEIVLAIRRLERHGRSDVIIVGRGGGSIEDLWAFNEEKVVRAIASCGIPIVSAVGHETDTTLSDYAADLRSPTPSAAAEVVTAQYQELLRRITIMSRSLNREIARHIESKRRSVEACSNSWALRRPVEQLGIAMQRVDDLSESLDQAANQRLERTGNSLRETTNRLARAAPLRKVDAARARVEHLRMRLSASRPDLRWRPRLEYARGKLGQLDLRLQAAMRGRLRENELSLRAVRGKLESLGPQSVLQRGFSIISTVKGNHIVTGPDQVAVGQTLRVQSAKGKWRVAALPRNELFDEI